MTLQKFPFPGTVNITLDRVEKIKSIIIEDVYEDGAVVYFIPKCQFEKPEYGKL